ncbi:MAG: BTAD domain-containing putative transcriptional regulator [Ilumatobacter sp.]
MVSDCLHVSLLDGFEVRVVGEQVTIHGLRSRQVLAYLIVHRDTATSAERLSDALWGDTPPASARNSIQRFISDLRRDLGPARGRLASAGSGYRLVLDDDDWCDALALEQALPQARDVLADGRPGDALALIGELPRASAQPLETVEGAFFVSAERLRLTELVADCGEVVAEARLAQGDSPGAITSARQFLEQHPYRERLCITLATALTRLGRATDGLSAIAAFRSRLRDELGLDPSPDMAQTELDILLHRDAAPAASIGRRQERALRVPDVVLAAPLIGRDPIVRRATELLETERVVTCTGTGGIGKTATALAIIESW